MMKRAIIMLLALAAGGNAFAADVSVTVRTPKGDPVENAVVTISGADRPGPAVPADLQMVQKNMQFHPFVMVAPRGASVSFPNMDRTRHHVYSFSPAGPFEMQLYGAGETRSVTFEKNGIIAVGCNIHDNMTAFIKVTDTPWAVITDSDGRAVIKDVAPGSRQIEIWHPYQKGGHDASFTESVEIPDTGILSREYEVVIQKPLGHHGSY